MPQFSQFESFAGQIFWLIVTFVVLYGLMVKIVMPRISGILEARAKKIEEDLALARLDHGKAEKILVEIEDKLEAAKLAARNILATAQAKEAEALAIALAKVDEEIRQETNQSIKEIERFKQEVRADLVNLVTDLTSDVIAKAGGRKVALSTLKQNVSQVVATSAVHN